MSRQLISRVKVALWGIPLALIVVFVGGWLFALFFAVVCLLAQTELFRLIGIKDVSSKISILWGGLLPVFVLLLQNHLIEYITAGFLLIVLISPMNGLKNIANRIAGSIMGIIYPSLFLSYIVLIRQAYWGDGLSGRLNGTLVIAFIMTTIWICDTLAYFGGKAIGKKKLAPIVSPNKTWEGFFFGLVGGLVWAGLFSYILPEYFGLWKCLGGGLIVGIVGQVGDLAESALKRSAGVKDTGNLLGPHGGILDRFDSLTACAPVFYIYFILVKVI